MKKRSFLSVLLYVGILAVALSLLMGVFDMGGMVRLGLAPYVTQSDIDRTLHAVRQMVTGA